MHEIEVEEPPGILEFESGVRASFEATRPRTRVCAESGADTTEGTIVLEHDRVIAAELRTSIDGLLPEVDADTNRSASSPIVSDVRGQSG